MDVAVIPALNEERRIERVVESAQSYVDRVIVIDDGSCDMTFEAAKRAGALALRNGSNMGKGFSFFRGMRFAFKVLGASACVVLDADGEHDPSDIPELLSVIHGRNSAWDMVVGNRFGTSEFDGETHGQMIHELASWITWSMTGFRLQDPLCGFRAYRRSFFFTAHLPPQERRLTLSRSRGLGPVLREKRFGLELEMLVQAMRGDTRIKEVPISASAVKNATAVKEVIDFVNVIADHNELSRWDLGPRGASRECRRRIYATLQYIRRQLHSGRDFDVYLDSPSGGQLCYHVSVLGERMKMKRLDFYPGQSRIVHSAR